MRKNICGLAIGTLTMACIPAYAAVVTIPAAQDAMIFGNSSNADTGNASGRGPALFAGADGSGNKKRSLIQFDIAGNIPANAQITGVTLTLYLGQIAGSGGGGTGGAIPSRTFDLYDLQQSWSEGTSGLIGNPPATSPSVGGSGQGYTRTAGDSSWDYADYPTTKWNNGTDLHGGNFAAKSSASSTFTSFVLNAPFTWSSTGMIADVQSWLDAPSSNDGWMLKSETGLDSSGNVVTLENTPTSFLGFWSRDGAAANNNPDIAPALTITYSVPEPTMAGLLAIGASAFSLHRRRRPA